MILLKSRLKKELADSKFFFFLKKKKGIPFQIKRIQINGEY